MSLAEYRRKRSFEQTPEPAPAEPAPVEEHRFCVQRHDATRLHYDFRLEIDGVLKSWAVPKGPSLKPMDKRAAFHVEDHPIEYLEFEGNIPKGNYGAGSVMLWDLGTFDLLGERPAAEQLARGDLKIRLHGQKLRGEFAVVHMKGRGKGNEWLLIKKRDDAADENWDVEEHARSVKTDRTQEEIARDVPPQPKGAKKKAAPKRTWPKGAVEASMPENLVAMAGCPASQPPRGKGWIFEVKWDGVRSLCYIRNGKVRLVSRNGNVMDRQYPELAVIHRDIDATEAIVDGEIVTFDAKGVPRFELLQKRITVADPNSIAHLLRRHPVVLFAFDLPYLEGHDLRQAPLIERKKLLESIIKPSNVLKLSDHFDDGIKLLEVARERGLEGIIAKRADSVYEARRSQAWQKIKIVSQQEFVIAGFTKGERDPFGSLALGVYEGNDLVYAGNVGTGFDQKALNDLYGRLKPLIVDKRPLKASPAIPKGTTWVRPELVCEVKFAEWTAEKRLRAPVYLGLRTDVSPRDVQPENETQQPRRTALIEEDKNEVFRDVDGVRLKLTNLKKVFYPDEGYTKRDLLNYYDAVAPLLVPHLEGRPLSLKRYPNGIAADYFFQKDADESFPDWLHIEPIQSEKRAIQYVIGKDRATLLYLVNLGCIDHNPWMSRIEALERPDFMLIDLDPQECDYDRIVEAALLVRKKLDALELEAYPKTTGGDGMHIYVPIEPVYSYADARNTVEIIARLLAAERPDLFTTPRAVAKREKGKVYFDYMQIVEGKTISAPYVLRAYRGAPVSTPLDWREVKTGLRPQQFHILNAPARFDKVGDLFAGVLHKKQRLEPALQKLDRLVKR